MNVFEFLLPAFLACIVLTGIHTYLGIHVISRGVIFVDIALAQIAALGMTLALLWGFHPEDESTYLFSLAATMAGAFFFAFFRNPKIPQEAIIGVSFALSQALSLLIADKMPHGGEHLKYLLNGNILWVSYPQIIKTALIYGILGFFHYRMRKSLLLVSTNPHQAQNQGLNIKRWDLIFYLSFGLVITSSVQIAGILLVFTYLIIPALCAFLFFDDLKKRLLLGWILGVGGSFLGLGASVTWDLPTGATLVATFGLVLIGCLIVKKLWPK